jgi:hypothetical protein
VTVGPIERGWWSAQWTVESTGAARSQSQACSLRPDGGPCKAIFTRYFYDQDARRCKSFTYGGCPGVVPFETLDECVLACE